MSSTLSGSGLDVHKGNQTLENLFSSGILSSENIYSYPQYIQQRIDLTLNFANKTEFAIEDVDTIIELLGFYGISYTGNSDLDQEISNKKLKLTFIQGDFSLLSEIFKKHVNALLNEENTLGNTHLLDNKLQELSDILLLVSRLFTIFFSSPAKRKNLQEVLVFLQGEINKLENILDDKSLDGNEDSQYIIQDHLLNSNAILGYLETMYFHVFSTDSNQSKAEIEGKYDEFKNNLKELKVLIDQGKVKLPENMHISFLENYQYLTTHLDLLLNSFQEQTLLNTKCKLDRKQYDIHEIEKNREIGLHCLLASYMQVAGYNQGFMDEYGDIDGDELEENIGNLQGIGYSLGFDSQEKNESFENILPYIFEDFICQLKNNNPKIFNLFRVIESIIFFVDFTDEKLVSEFQEKINDTLNEKQVLENINFPHGSFNLFEPIIGVAINFKQMLKQLTIDNRTDYLTKLGNRKAGEEYLEKIVSYMSRHKENQQNSKKWIMMFDIDDFKKINDTYGHDIGDYVLQSLSEVLKTVMRKEDFIFRWGGEEFVMIVECGDITKAQKCAEKLRKLVVNEVTKKLVEKVNTYKESITVSIGVHNIFESLDSENIDPQQDIFKKVDEATYFSKSHGKNRVTFSQEILENKNK